MDFSGSTENPLLSVYPHQSSIINNNNTMSFSSAAAPSSFINDQQQQELRNQAILFGNDFNHHHHQQEPSKQVEATFPKLLHHDKTSHDFMAQQEWFFAAYFSSKAEDVPEEIQRQRVPRPLLTSVFRMDPRFVLMETYYDVSKPSTDYETHFQPGKGATKATDPVVIQAEFGQDQRLENIGTIRAPSQVPLHLFITKNQSCYDGRVIIVPASPTFGRTRIRIINFLIWMFGFFTIAMVVVSAMLIWSEKTASSACCAPQICRASFERQFQNPGQTFSDATDGIIWPEDDGGCSLRKAETTTDENYCGLVGSNFSGCLVGRSNSRASAKCSRDELALGTGICGLLVAIWFACLTFYNLPLMKTATVDTSFASAVTWTLAVAISFYLPLIVMAPIRLAQNAASPSASDIVDSALYKNLTGNNCTFFNQNPILLVTADRDKLQLQQILLGLSLGMTLLTIIICVLAPFVFERENIFSVTQMNEAAFREIMDSIPQLDDHPNLRHLRPVPQNNANHQTKTVSIGGATRVVYPDSDSD